MQLEESAQIAETHKKYAPLIHKNVVVEVA